MPKVVICRTMYCPRCNASDHPTKGDVFIVYGSKRKTLMQRIAQWYGVKGYTPHIISFDQPLKMKDGKVEIIVSCGVCEMVYDYIDMEAVFVIKKAHVIHLPKKDFDALVLYCKHLGYDI